MHEVKISLSCSMNIIYFERSSVYFSTSTLLQDILRSLKFVFVVFLYYTVLTVCFILILGSPKFVCVVLSY